VTNNTDITDNTDNTDKIYKTSNVVMFSHLYLFDVQPISLLEDILCISYYHKTDKDKKFHINTADINGNYGLFNIPTKRLHNESILVNDKFICITHKI
jgi:hypothetical protein